LGWVWRKAVGWVSVGAWFETAPVIAPGGTSAGLSLKGVADLRALCHTNGTL
jgi:hypothetical protein